MSAQRESTPSFLLTAVVPFVVIAIVVACGTEPTTAIKRSQIGEVGLAKPTPCNASVDLVITMRDQAGDAVLSDGSAYVEGVDGVGAHFSDVNGNLMLTVQQSTNRRIGWSTPASSGQSNDRLYTNSHTNPGGNNACGLFGMVVGSTGSAAVAFELWQEPPRADIIHYGKTCSGAAVPSTRVTTTHPDADTWVITGTSGVHCRPRPTGTKVDSVAVAGPFEMTLVRQ